MRRLKRAFGRLERDANEKADLKGRFTKLEKVHAKVGELEQVFT